MSKFVEKMAIVTTNLSQNDSLIKMKIDELRCIASLTELAKRFDCKKFVCCDIITRDVVRI